MSNRAHIIAELATRICELSMPHPVRVGIDGVDCAGKTTPADELEVLLRSGLQDVIRCSIDRFHNPREIRYR